MDDVQKLKDRIIRLEKELHVQKTIATGAIMAVGTRLDTDPAFAEKADRDGLLNESLELLEEMDGGRRPPGDGWTGYYQRVQNCLTKAKEKGLIK